jgi:hypothetical protein
MTVSFKLEIKYGSLPSSPYVDETAYLLDFNVRVGMPIGDRFGAIADIGRAEFTLDNRTRRFSERNASSPLYGTVATNRPMRFTVNDESGSGNDRVLFRGYCSAWVSDGERYGSREITLHCVDYVWLWQQTPVSDIDGSKTAQVDDTLFFLVSQAGMFGDLIEDNDDALTQGLIGIEVGRTSVYDALRLVAENFFGRCYYEPDSDSLLYLTRNNFRTESGSYAALGDASYLKFQDRHAKADEVGNVFITLYPQRTIGSEVVLWQAGATLRIAAGATRVLSLPYRDPDTGRVCEAVDVVAPVATTDYTVVTEVSWPITFSITVSASIELRRVVLTITNPLAYEAYFTLLRVRGKPVTTYEPLRMEYSSGAGTVFDFPMRVQPEDGVQLMAYIAARFAAVHHCEWCEIDGSEASPFSNFESYVLGEYVGITETQSGLNGVPHLIRRIEYRGVRGKAAVMRLFFDGLPTYNYFTLDSSALDGPDILGW